MVNRTDELKSPANILFQSAIFIYFILMFLQIYGIVTGGHFLIGEDYSWLWTSPWKGIDKHSFYSYIREHQIEGRPLEKMFLYVSYNKYINVLKSYEAVNTVRYIGIIGIGVLAYVLYQIFRESRFKKEHALLLSILICTLPPIQVYIGRVICIVLLYSFLLSALSVLILFKAFFRDTMDKKANMMVAVPAAIILLIAAFCIYQPTATIYFALAAIPLIIIKDEDLIKKWRLPSAVYISAGFASMCLYFGFIKIFNSFMNLELTGRGAFIYRPVDIYKKLVWFISDPLYTSLNLWNVVRSKEVALFVSIVIISGILCGFGHMALQIIKGKKGGSSLWILLFRYLLVFILMLLSFISNLLIKGSTQGAALFHHRTLLGPSIIILLLFYWGLMNITECIKSALNFSEGLRNRILTVLVVILAVTASFLANHNVDKYFVKRHTDEYNYVKNIVQEYGGSKLSNTSKIYLKSPGQDWIRSNVNYGEFGFRSSGGRISAIAMVKLVLYELGTTSDIPVDFITVEESNWKSPDDGNALIIDMRNFK